MRDRAFVEGFVTFMNQLASTDAVKTATKAAEAAEAARPVNPVQQATERVGQQVSKIVAEKMAGASQQERESLRELAIQSAIDSCGRSFLAEKYERSEHLATTLLMSAPSHVLFQLLLIGALRRSQQQSSWPMLANMLAQVIKDPWYQDLLKLTLGQADPAQVLARAKDDDQRCEALFYTATRLKTLGQAEASRLVLTQCAAVNSTIAENRIAKAAPAA